MAKARQRTRQHGHKTCSKHISKNVRHSTQLRHAHTSSSTLPSSRSAVQTSSLNQKYMATSCSTSTNQTKSSLPNSTEKPLQKSTSKTGKTAGEVRHVQQLRTERNQQGQQPRSPRPIPRSHACHTARNLGIKHNPFHYDFKMRYVHYELPPKMIEKLEHLLRQGPEGSAERIAAKHPSGSVK